jgi:hypothetical protein
MRSIVQRISYLPVAALLFSGSWLVASPAASAVGPPAAVQPATAHNAEEASRLLKEIRVISEQLKRDSATLESFRFSRMDWRSHVYQLNVAKEHVNEIGERLMKLQAIRNTSEPWQQKAIDTIVPIGVNLASQTNNAINLLNENRPQVKHPDYTERVTMLADDAERMSHSVDAYLDLSAAQNKLDSLQGKAAEIES